jgi:plasmid maintenance system antidote protein VapI
MTVKVSPKDIIREEIECRGWNAQILAHEAGWTPRLAAEVLQGRKITRLLAIGLGQAFGTSEQLWVNLQAAYESAEDTTPRRGRTARKPKASEAQLVPIVQARPAASELPEVTINGTEATSV